VEGGVKEWLNGLASEVCDEGMQKLVTGLDKCQHVGGDCVEKQLASKHKSLFIVIKAACFDLVRWSFSFIWRYGPTRARASSFLRFLDHTRRRATVGRTPLDE
jgi:hypothetical protein